MKGISEKMERTYKCIPDYEFLNGRYKLVPIRDEDKYHIMDWRNEQIDILRQTEPLTKESQDLYFKNVVSKLFEQSKPNQLLFSFFEDNVFIGYGGLVHIDWESKSGEVSFITATERNNNKEQFVNDWKSYLEILKGIAFKYLKFAKIYTYAYDLRPWLYEALHLSHFSEEARLKNHISIKGKLYDVLIHSYLFPILTFRAADKKDVQLYYDWANDNLVRLNSFNQKTIEFSQHEKWFADKLNSLTCLMLVAYKEENPIGQIRFDETGSGQYEIDFSISKHYRGFGFGNEILKSGVQELVCKRPGVSKVIGKVKTGNVASKMSFEAAGFKYDKEQSDSTVDLYFVDFDKK